MTEKTEAQIEKEQDAIKKMVGAKAAMELSINRIKTLEDAISDIQSLANVIASASSHEAYVKACRDQNGKRTSAPELHSVHRIMDFINYKVSQVIR